jgi:hypothetical protein
MIQSELSSCAARLLPGNPVARLDRRSERRAQMAVGGVACKAASRQRCRDNKHKLVGNSDE